MDKSKKIVINCCLLVFLMVGFLIGLQMIHAASPDAKTEIIDYTPQITIPGSMFVKGQPIHLNEHPNLMGDYIMAIYKFFVGISGIIAVIMIAFGGYIWLFSGGNSEKISSAKEYIFGAVIGLMIALGSYLILYIVNPSLVNISVSLGRVRVIVSNTATTTPAEELIKEVKICEGLHAGKNCPSFETDPKTGKATCLYLAVVSPSSQICDIFSEATVFDEANMDNTSIEVVDSRNGNLAKVYKISQNAIGLGDNANPIDFNLDNSYTCGELHKSAVWGLGGLAGYNYNLGTKCPDDTPSCSIFYLKHPEGISDVIGMNSIAREGIGVNRTILGRFKKTYCQKTN